VGLDRTVVQMPGYIADIYRCWSNATRTYDYPLCFRGALDALDGVDAAKLKPLGPPASRGYKHIVVREPIQTDQPWTGTWRREASDTNPANLVKVILLGAPKTAIHIGQNVDERHQVVVRRQAKETVFAAVIDPYRDLDVVRSVERLEITGPVPACGLRVKRTDGSTDTILVRYDAQKDGQLGPASSFDGGSTNALVSVVRLDAQGRLVELGMLGGTQCAFGARTLAMDKPGIKWER